MKLVSPTQYLMWSIGASLLQAEFEGTELPLMLADRIFQQLVGSGAVTTDEEVRMYLDILRRREQYDRMVEVLQGPLGALYRLQEERIRELVDACMVRSCASWPPLFSLRRVMRCEGLGVVGGIGVPMT